VTLTLLWAGIGATMIWSVDATWLRLTLAAIAIGVTAHVARLPAWRPAAYEPSDVSLFRPS